jgi:hypothetical protein
MGKGPPKASRTEYMFQRRSSIVAGGIVGQPTFFAMSGPIRTCRSRCADNDIGSSISFVIHISKCMSNLSKNEYGYTKINNYKYTYSE